MRHSTNARTVQSDLVQLDQAKNLFYQVPPPVTTTTTATTPAPTDIVTVNVTWTFTSGVNLTNIIMITKNLKSAQWIALGLAQNQSMVFIKECFS